MALSIMALALYKLRQEHKREYGPDGGAYANGDTSRSPILPESAKKRRTMWD